MHKPFLDAPKYIGMKIFLASLFAGSITGEVFQRNYCKKKSRLMFYDSIIPLFLIGLEFQL